MQRVRYVSCQAESLAALNREAFFIRGFEGGESQHSRGVWDCSVLFHAQGVLGCDARKGRGAAGVNAGEIARVVMRIEAALVIAAYIQAFDGFARLVEGLAVHVGNHAVNGHEQRACDTSRVERRGFDVAQAISRLP